MNCGFELTDIDWSNQDINKVVEFFSKKFNAQDIEITRQGDALAQKDDTIAQKDDAIAQKDDTIAQLQDRIKQLEEQVAQIKLSGRGGKKPRNYNVRKYK